MAGPSKIAIAALRECRDRPSGVTIYPRQGFFCSASFHMTAFREIAGLGLVEVIGGRIYISKAGLDLLDGVP